MTSLIPSQPRSRAWIGIAIVVVGLVFLSPLFGRAKVTEAYRPDLPPDGLTNGCWPLPGDVELDFPYVLRSDGVISSAQGLRRRVVLHFDYVDAAEAKASAEQAFRKAGVLHQVHVEATDFESITEDAVIRGEMVLDLPSILPQSTDPTSAVCTDVYSTKRFTPDLPDRS